MATTCPNSLYPFLLGEEWERLPTCIRRCHAETGGVRVTGRLKIVHGGFAAGLMARLMGLPAASNDTPVILEIEPSADGEIWTRSFGDRVLITKQEQRKDGLLHEQFGRLDLRFRLRADGVSLTYLPAGADLRLGSHSLPIPALIAPVVEAREVASGPGGESNHVTVEVRLPLLGRLIRYEGMLDVQEAEP